MASKGTSRWADSEGDAALDAERKKEKQEKKRLKAEKARKEAERQAAQAASAQQRQPAESADGNEADRPAKRQRLNPEVRNAQDQGSEGAEGDGTALLRFSSGGFGKCRSVENYDKLNDIEEGAYGWVARAKELATGEVVALKRLKIDPKDRAGLPITGLREMQILRDCDHRNIVKLREVVVSEDTSRIEK